MNLFQMEKYKQIYLWSVFLFALVLSFFSLQNSPWSLHALSYAADEKLALNEMLFYQFENPDYLLNATKNFHPAFFSAALFLPSSWFFVTTTIFFVLSLFILMQFVARKNFSSALANPVKSAKSKKENFFAYIFLLLFLPWFIQPFSGGIIFLWFAALILFVYLKNHDKKKWLWIVELSLIFLISPFVALPLLFFLPLFFVFTVSFLPSYSFKKDKKQFLFVLFLAIFSFAVYFLFRKIFLLDNSFYLKNILDFFFIEHLPAKDYQGNKFLISGIWFLTISTLYIFLLQIGYLFFSRKILMEKFINSAEAKQNYLKKIILQNTIWFLLVVLHFLLQLFFLEQPSYFLLQMMLAFSFFYLFLFPQNLQFSLFSQKIKQMTTKNKIKTFYVRFFFLTLSYLLILKIFFTPVFFLQKTKLFTLPSQKKWVVSAVDLHNFPVEAKQMISINLVDLHVIPYNQEKIPHLFIEQPGEKKQPLFSNKMKKFYAQEMSHAKNIFKEIESSAHKENYALFLSSSLPLKNEKFPFRRVYLWKKEHNSVKLFLSSPVKDY